MSYQRPTTTTTEERTGRVSRKSTHVLFPDGSWVSREDVTTYPKYGFRPSRRTSCRASERTEGRSHRITQALFMDALAYNSYAAAKEATS